MEYRRKAVNITAVQYDGSLESLQPLGDLAAEKVISIRQYLITRHLEIITQSNALSVGVGDYVLKESGKELAVCNAALFEVAYEPIV